jgi:hypothetical protein
MTSRILHQSSSQANMDVYIHARPVARSEARFPPPHQEPGTGARSCPRGPGFLVARAIELAQAHVPDAGRPTVSRTTQRTARRRPGPARSQRRTRPRPAFLTGGPSWPRWPGPRSRRCRRPSVSPVIFKIFRIRCCVQTRSSEPSWARTRLRPPPSTPRPAESRNPTLSKLRTSWQLPMLTRSMSSPAAPARYTCRSRLHVDDLDAVLGRTARRCRPVGPAGGDGRHRCLSGEPRLDLNPHRAQRRQFDRLDLPRRDEESCDRTITGDGEPTKGPA